MKSRFKAWSAAAVAIVTVFSLSTTVFAASKTYDATKEFAREVKADSVWHYKYNDGSGFKEYSNFYKDWDAWVIPDDPSPGPYSNVGMTDGKLYLHPDKYQDTGAAIDVAVTWTAPADGTVTIPAVTVAHDGANDPDDDKGTKVWIEFAGKKYDETAIDFSSSAKLVEVKLNVKQGDEIIFAADNNGRGGNNLTYWPITVKFDDVAAAGGDSNAASDDSNSASDGASDGSTATPNPKTGDSGVMAYSLASVASAAGLVLLLRKKRAASEK